MKTTKAQLESVAKELTLLMDLDLPIPTGRKAIKAGLEKDIREAAQKLAPSDTLSLESREVLAALGIQLPESEETPDLAKDKPKPDKPLSACAFVMHAVCKNPKITKDEIRVKLDKRNYTLKDSSIETALSDTRKVVNHLIGIGKLKY